MIFFQIAWLFTLKKKKKKSIAGQFSSDAIMDEFESLKGRRVQFS